METKSKTILTVEALLEVPVNKVWVLWTAPEHIIHWNHASDDWHTPHAVNDVRVGGKFSWRMEAKDGSFGFDFGGTYTAVKPEEFLEYKLGEEREVKISFLRISDHTKLIETFEAEGVNPIEMQLQGWQAILNNFKKYAEQGF